MLRNKALFIILLFGLALRFYKFNIPLLEFYPSRQIQTAEISRNFFRGRLNIFHPTVSYFGSVEQPFLLEFPGYNFFVALLYRLTGSADEYLGRAVSIFSWAISAIFLYKITRELASEIAAYIALIFYSLSPLSILVSRSFQPDQTMILFSIAGFYYFLQWTKNGKYPLLIASSIFISLSILFKSPSIVFSFFPILIYFLIKKRDKVREFGLFTTISLVPSLIWYIYAFFQKQYTTITYGGFSVSTWFAFDVFLNSNFYRNVFGFEYNLVLLPVGLMLLLIGVFQKLKPHQIFLRFWLLCVFTYFVLFNKHNMTHEYYHLPILPIASIYIAIAGERIYSALKSSFHFKTIFGICFIILLFLLTIIPTYQRAYKPIDRFSHVLDTANDIQQISKPGDLIIGSMDAGPSLLYYSNRRGWQFNVDRKNEEEQLSFYGVKYLKVQDPIEELETLKGQGANIFASASKDQFLSNASFSKYMYSNYLTIVDNKNYVIFSLKKKSI